MSELKKNIEFIFFFWKKNIKIKAGNSSQKIIQQSEFMNLISSEKKLGLFVTKLNCINSQG